MSDDNLLVLSLVHHQVAMRLQPLGLHLFRNAISCNVVGDAHKIFFVKERSLRLWVLGMRNSQDVLFIQFRHRLIDSHTNQVHLDLALLGHEQIRRLICAAGKNNRTIKHFSQRSVLVVYGVGDAVRVGNIPARVHGVRLRANDVRLDSIALKQTVGNLPLMLHDRACLLGRLAHLPDVADDGRDFLGHYLSLKVLRILNSTTPSFFLATRFFSKNTRSPSSVARRVSVSGPSFRMMTWPSTLNSISQSWFHEP